MATEAALPDTPIPTIPPARDSVLGNLKARRESIAKAQVKEIPVPRWEDPEVWVIYEPLEHPFIRSKFSTIEKAENRKKGEVEVNVNADVLIKACVGVYAKLGGKRYSLRPDEPDGELTRFDPDLAANLGLPENATAREVVRSLFFTDGDIISTAQQVIEFSGYRENEATEEIEGE